MSFTNFFISRPRLAIVLNIFIFLVGCIAFTKIKMQIMPNISSSSINITFYYNNCSPTYIEKNIVAPTEKVLKGLSGLEDISSSSVTGGGSLQLLFNPKINIKEVLNDVKDKIWGLQHIFPDDMKMPSIKIGSANEEYPNMYFAIIGENHNDIFITDLISDFIKPKIEQLPEVGQVTLIGGKELGIHIVPIKTKMYQYNLDYSQISDLIKREIQEHPLGFIDCNKRYLIKLDSDEKKLDAIKNIVITKNENGSILRLSEVCDVAFKEIEYDFLCRYNGHMAQVLSVSSAYNFSDIDSSKAVKNIIPKIQSLLPEGVKIQELKNDGKTLKEGGIDKLYSVCLETIFIVVIIIFLFLGSIQLTIIPIITIPISLAGSCIFMYLFGFSVNIITLISITLAVGLVVDDSIIMLENINRHSNKLKKSPIQATTDASNEIGFAIIAITLTLFAVFLPFIFLDSTLSKFFNEFIWTLSFCVLLSGIVSLTLTPVLTKIAISKKSYNKARIYYVIDNALLNLQNKYEKYLLLSIKYKKTFFAICIGFPIVLVALIFVFKITITLFSKEDSGGICINMEGPSSFVLDDTLCCVKKVEKILFEEEYIDFNFVINIDPSYLNKALCYVKFKENKKLSIDDIVKRLNIKLSDIPDMKLFAFNHVAIGSTGSDNSDVSFSVVSPYMDYDVLKNTCDSLVDRMKKHNIFKSISIDYPVLPALEVSIDQCASNMCNVSNNSIKKALSDFVVSNNIGYITTGSKTYPILLASDKTDKKSINNLLSISVKKEGHISKMLPLSNLANIVNSTSLIRNNHHDCFKSINISAQLEAKQSLVEVRSIMDQISSDILNDGSYIKYFGQMKQLESSKSAGLFLLTFSVVFIFLILSAQFESFICALIILISIPFAFTGGLFSLLIFRDAVSIFSCVGLITLIGLVTKNAIMIVEFANKLIKEDNMDTKNAIIKASTLRLRAILMTSLATISGSLLLTLGSGFGANSFKSIGLTITGGMVVSTIFTIFIIPVTYYYFFKNKQINQIN